MDYARGTDKNVGVAAEPEPSGGSLRRALRWVALIMRLFPPPFLTFGRAKPLMGRTREGIMARQSFVMRVSNETGGAALTHARRRAAEICRCAVSSGAQY